MVLTRGADQAPVSTKFDMRSDPNVIRNYGKMLVSLAAVVPDGVVCFFVSYRYMDAIIAKWHEMGILQVRRHARSSRPLHPPVRPCLGNYESELLTMRREQRHHNAALRAARPSFRNVWCGTSTFCCNGQRGDVAAARAQCNIMSSMLCRS